MTESPVSSAFSSVDSASDPRRLVASLEGSAIGLAAMKHYMAVTHALRRPTKPVLDLGCGAGHGLALLEGLGVPAIGLDPSEVMVRTSRTRTASPLVRGTGDRLPFAAGAFAGCGIERVLMHVEDPPSVIDEVVRCVQPGGLLTIFEPDWWSLSVNGMAVPRGWASVARHPDIGAKVGDLLRAAGCSIRDRVEERSWWTYADVVRITNRVPPPEWGPKEGFSARIDKVLWVATTPT